MKKLLADTAKSDYNITVIDHVKHTMANITLDDLISIHNSNLSNFDSVLMSEVAHDTLSSYKEYKPAKSTVVVTTATSTSYQELGTSSSDYSSLSCKFASPDIFADLFLDKIEITIPLSRSESKRLHSILIEEEMRLVRVKQHSHANAKGVKFNKSFSIEAEQFSSLQLLIKPISKKIKELKLSYNPSNYQEKDLRVLVKKLKKLCGRHFKNRILKSNVTRVDVTFDSDGYFVGDTTINLDKSSSYKAFFSANGVVETKITGANKSRRVQVYNKNAERVKRGVDSNKVCTRLEMTIRPYNVKSVKGLKLKDIEVGADLYTGLFAYDTDKLSTLLGEGTQDWEIVKYFGIAALRRTKNNTDRVKLTKILKQCQLDINETMFNKLIRYMLCEVRAKLLA
ncbi:hypothetical protein Shal_4055 [Shewanella halifaxensis HAW-EB4]|uniref:Uncharacterized protein n=1 Tax=Shewanella halifaxensis (strain HAW-EB4) TaxID=458817 RepID=B0TKK9_SHEHH|nr:hypothetical protein [Shewanella halifaxensis]ABZ78595.1 hypothetical protein Shal_4055 [Shewanella halifaxensis HAW-EB4]